MPGSADTSDSHRLRPSIKSSEVPVFHYNPTRQPTLVRENDLRIVRRLPVTGEVHVKVGERVEASAIVATGEQVPATIVRECLAAISGSSRVPPKRDLVKEPGQQVSRRGSHRPPSPRPPHADRAHHRSAGTFVRFDSLLGTAADPPRGDPHRAAGLRRRRDRGGRAGAWRDNSHLRLALLRSFRRRQRSVRRLEDRRRAIGNDRSART